MGRLKDTSHFAVDSMILIYFTEDNPKFADQAEKLLKNASHITISAMGFGEILAGFEKQNDKNGKLQFLSFLEALKNISIISFTKQEALIFAQLRAKYPSIKPPDAIHLATAICSGADAFVTNDKNLRQVEEIEVLLLSKAIIN